MAGLVRSYDLVFTYPCQPPPPRLSGAFGFNPSRTAQNAEGVEPASALTIPESAAGTITVPVRIDRF